MTETNELRAAAQGTNAGTLRKPLVSICINNYNYARFLRVAVDSALNQTYSPVEVIVVDDGSTDGSAEILSSYGGKIQCVFQMNQHQAVAVNQAFALSKGEILIFLDSDDALTPDAVECVVNAWKPSVSKVQFALAVIDEAGKCKAMRMPGLPLDSGNVVPLLLKTGHYVTPPMSGNAYTRSHLENLLPIPESWRQTGKWVDAYLGHLVPFSGPVASIDELKGFYRIHTANHSSQAGESRDGMVKKLTEYLRTEWAVRSIIEEVAIKRGLQISAGAVIGHYSVLKAHLSLLRLGGRSEGGPNWSVTRVTTKFICAILGSRYHKWSARVMLAGWALLTYFSRGQMTDNLVALGMTPGSRPRWLNRTPRTIPIEAGNN